MAVEEQTNHNYTSNIYPPGNTHRGQRLTIADRKVTKLGFWLLKVGAPTDNLTLQIMKVSDDSIIVSKVWGNAGDLPTEATYIEVEFETPVTINEEVRIVPKYESGDNDNCPAIRIQLEDVKADEWWTYGKPGAWSENTAFDTAYRYTYEEPPAAPPAKPHTFRLDPKPRQRMSFHPNLKLG